VTGQAQTLNHLFLGSFFNFGKEQPKSSASSNPELAILALFFSKSTSLDAALGVTKFITITAMHLVTLMFSLSPTLARRSLTSSNILRMPLQTDKHFLVFIQNFSPISLSCLSWVWLKPLTIYSGVKCSSD
jgi:hypothetical protein